MSYKSFDVSKKQIIENTCRAWHAIDHIDYDDSDIPAKLEWLDNFVTNRIYAHEFHLNWSKGLDELLRLIKYKQESLTRPRITYPNVSFRDIQITSSITLNDQCLAKAYQAAEKIDTDDTHLQDKLVWLFLLRDNVIRATMGGVDAMMRAKTEILVDAKLNIIKTLIAKKQAQE